MTPHAGATVLAVASSARHEFSKRPALFVRLLAGLGVEGDAHAGRTVRHRSRVAADPAQPNLRQVHLIHSELFDELRARDAAWDVRPGELGENVTTRGLALLDLPVGTLLRLGDEAVVKLTGLRNPCRQIDAFRPGLMEAMLDRSPSGALVRKSGVMGVVVAGGEVRAGDAITVELPERPHRPLERV